MIELVIFVVAGALHSACYVHLVYFIINGYRVEESAIVVLGPGCDAVVVLPMACVFSALAISLLLPLIYRIDRYSEGRGLASLEKSG